MLKNVVLELFAALRAIVDAVLCMTLIQKPFDIALGILFVTGIGLGHNLVMARDSKRALATKRVCGAIELSFALALVPKWIGCDICYGSMKIFGTAISIDLAFAGLLILFVAGIARVGRARRKP